MTENVNISGERAPLLAVEDVFLVEGTQVIGGDSAINTHVIKIGRGGRFLSSRISFLYKTIDGTAQAPADYVELLGRADLKSGDREVSLLISIVSDIEKEEDEDFKIELEKVMEDDRISYPSDYEFKVTIVNDDFDA